MYNKKKIGAIVEARMNSTRLPGKILMDIGNKPSLKHTTDRLALVKEIDEIIIATTTNKNDDVVEIFCKKNNISCFRGSENNVLNRVLKASYKFDIDIIVEITGDSVFVDHQIISEAITEYLNGNNDFVANCVSEPMYIAGFDARVFATHLLQEIEKKIVDDEDFEHVTSYIWKNPSKFSIKNIAPPKLLESGSIFLGLDTTEDLKLLREIYKALGKEDLYFNGEEIVKFLKNNNEIAKINDNIKRNIV